MEQDASKEEIVFNNIFQSITLYSTQNVVIKLNKNKDELIEILKIYRPIKLSNFQYGLNDQRRENSRLFVFEFENDKTKVREYINKEKEAWYCRECKLKKFKTIRLILKYGIIFVKKDHNCKPRELSAVMAIQASLGNKKFLGNNFENVSTESSQIIYFSKNHAEALVKTIKKSPKQYTTEVIKNWDSFKLRILEILENYRPIKLSNFRYGMNQLRHENFHLIIFEFDNDKTKVREYFKNRRCWYCCECKIAQTRIIIDYGILFVPNQHYCVPREYAVVMAIQKLYKNKKIGSVGNYYTQKKLMEVDSASTESENTVTEFEGNINDNEEEDNDDDCIINIPKNHAALEAIFATIKNSLKQYTKKLIKNWDPLKSKILEILKTYRPIKLSNFQYGMNRFRRENSRLIVQEFDNNKTKCREYFKNTYWYCCDCKRINIRQRKIIFEYGILFVPNVHNCEPREYAVVMAVQNMYKINKTGSIPQYHTQKKLMEGHSTSTASDETSSEDESENIVTEELSATVPTSPEFEGSSNDNEEDDDCIILEGDDVKPSPSKKPQVIMNDMENKRNDKKVDYTSLGDTCENISINKLPTISTNSKLNVINNKNDEDDDCIILEDNDDDLKPPASKKPRHDQSHENQPQYFVIEKPSTLILKKACTKFDIFYKNEAYKLWSKIDIDKIDISLFSSYTSTTTVHLHNFKTKNIFELFSLLLTGSPEKYYQIQYCINEAFRQKMINSGKMTLAQFDKIIMFPKITNEQLSFLCKFLPCRIIIFEENYEKRFGKWNSSENENIEILTFVFSCFNEFYSIVLKV